MEKLHDELISKDREMQKKKITGQVVLKYNKSTDKVVNISKLVGRNGE